MSANSLFTTMVHVLALLAGADAPLSSSCIAASVNTNPVSIRRVVGRLRDAGLVETIPGSAGGARLAMGAGQITLGDVYRLARRDSFFGMPANPPNPACPVGRHIQDVLGGICDELDDLVYGALAAVSVAQIADRLVKPDGTGTALRGADRSVRTRPHG